MHPPKPESFVRPTSFCHVSFQSRHEPMRVIDAKDQSLSARSGLALTGKAQSLCVCPLVDSFSLDRFSSTATL